MFGWSKLKSLFSKRKVGVIVPVLAALALLWLVLASPISTSAQDPTLSPNIPMQVSLPWKIHLYAIPFVDGTGIFAFTGDVSNICRDGKITFTAEFLGSPTTFPGNYDPGKGVYFGALNSFFPPDNNIYKASLEAVCISLRGDEVRTDRVIFTRYHYNKNNPTPTSIISDDQLAELELNSNSLDKPHFVIVMDANGLPKELPAGTQPFGRPYSFRASSGAVETDNKVPLSLYYQDAVLGKASPLTLRIFEWNAPSNSWVDTENHSLRVPLLDFPHLNKPTNKFTTYILASTPQWCDSFTSNIGLQTSNNIGLNSGQLELENRAMMTGTATSTVYSPTLRLLSWHNVTYTPNIPTDTSLTVSVLGQAGQILKANVKSGQSLNDIDPKLHPGLRLQVGMTTTVSSTTPELLDWCLLANVAASEVFLPLVVKP